ncbi:lanthionine synthetase C family protein [Nocardia sp. NPDC019395]|uniref:lanthionine synthetase C family protein n=1 Tax=Nocardia sp. NPDC019395 TaxID=3154686 RepID=UPI0034106965
MRNDPSYPPLHKNTILIWSKILAVPISIDRRVWTMAMDSIFARPAEQVAYRLAQLADPDLSLPRPRPHEAAGLASGYSGCALALLYAGQVLNAPDLTESARALLKQAADTTVVHAIHQPGLHNGLCGFTAVLAEFAGQEPRYLPTLRRLADQLGTKLLETTRSRPGDGLPFTAYDLISGAAGQLATTVRLLTMMDSPPESMSNAAEHLADYLMQITDIDEHGRPGWLITPDRYPIGFSWYGERSPHGMYNLGLAHGLPGILAALCTAARAGIGGTPVAERVRELALWLSEHTCETATGPAWPTAFNARPGDRTLEYDPHSRPARTAWCYGAPGVTAALFSAAAVADLPQVTEVATAALRNVRHTNSHDRNVFSVTLCHGRAGIAASAHRAYRMTGIEEFSRMRDEELEVAISHADPTRPFIFADEPQHGEYIDDPGFLTGAAGVLLSLLSPLDPKRTAWDALLFL